MNKYYLEAVKRFGLSSNIPEYEPEVNKIQLSAAEREFALSERKWHIDHDPLPKPSPFDELDKLIADTMKELEKKDLTDEIRAELNATKTKAELLKNKSQEEGK
jgi:hypothetical protein